MGVKEFKQTPEGKKIYEDALVKKQEIINAENQLHLHYISKDFDEQKEHCSKVTGEIFPRLSSIENQSAERKGINIVIKALIIGIALTIGSIICGYLLNGLG